MQPNPFDCQEPLLPGADGRLAVERGRELRQAVGLLHRGGFLTVSAPPRSGVTTFLYTLRKRLPRAAFLDLANLSFADDPAREAAQVLSRELSTRLPGFEPQADPLSVADVLGAVTAHGETLGPAPDRLTVVVDGFDAWSDESARKLALALRAAYTEARTRGAGGAFAVVTGSSVDLRDLTASGRTSPLNIAQHLFLPDFQEAETADLLRRGLGAVLDPEEVMGWVKYATHWSGGHPCLVQMIGQHAFDLRASGVGATQAFERVLPRLREETTDLLGPTLGVLAERPDLRKSAGEIYSGAAVPFDRIHRPIRELLHMGLIRADPRGFCKPRNPLFASVLAAALNLDANAPAAGLWDSEASGRVTRPPGEPTMELRELVLSEEDSDPFVAEPGDTTVPPSPPEVFRQRAVSPKPLRPDAPMLLPGALLGGCRVEKRIGRGAMSEVYLARHVALDTDVALKVLRRAAQEDRRIAQRFLREARAAAQLRHEHIVQIRNVGRDGEHRYIEMEFLGGGSLARFLGSEPYSETERAIEMLRQAALGLQAAHAKGVIHRDIKPDNLMLAEDGKLKLVDFGLAALMSLEESRLTQEGTILGTPHYMAPEQWEGNVADERTDLYSLGATFYHLLAGRPPFDGKTIVELIGNFTSRELVPLDKVNRAVPKRLARVVERMLAKNPKERFGNVADLMEGLRRA
ncbi:MAG: serine/threonine protein kinase [Planctomycetota bacterium]|nr:serine/threonine protein kinase [Planctomycetota bacterium]